MPRCRGEWLAHGLVLESPHACRHDRAPTKNPGLGPLRPLRPTVVNTVGITTVSFVRCPIHFRSASLSSGADLINATACCGEDDFQLDHRIPPGNSRELFLDAEMATMSLPLRQLGDVLVRDVGVQH